MTLQRYSVNQHTVQTLLTWIKTNHIAVPEIQRPFVWDAAKVRDFIDSLYQGYPVGFLIVWCNPTVQLKDGTAAAGRRILIDGQQRITALLAALLGEPIVTKAYKRVRITIAFHPDKQRFEVLSAAHQRDPAWIDDIATLFAPGANLLERVEAYCASNPGADRNTIFNRLNRLQGLQNNPLGLIDLNADLEVEEVADIFIRINSKGVPLNAADFAMSKLAANEKHNGPQLRKCIDYFCHLAVAPADHAELATDSAFAATPHFQAMAWLKDGKDDLYDPSYTDMLRVAFTAEFGRGPLGELVALLSGRNFETRTFEEAIMAATFERLDQALLRFMNETNFKKFMMILRSAGFVTAGMIGSQNALNFAYIVYLTLRGQGVAPARIETLVRRWFVMSVLTGRYTGSAETAFGVDIRALAEQDAGEALEAVERAELSSAFWEAGLPQQMSSSVRTNPAFSVFLASQVKAGAKGFLSRELTVQVLLEGTSHIHHVFPQAYLKAQGLPPSRYNQVANYVVMQSEINIAVGGRPPADYFSALARQCATGIPQYGGITEADALHANLQAHGIPAGMETVDIDGYDAFLQERRRLMAQKIRDYYMAL